MRIPNLPYEYKWASSVCSSRDAERRLCLCWTKDDKKDLKIKTTMHKPCVFFPIPEYDCALFPLGREEGQLLPTWQQVHERSKRRFFHSSYHRGGQWALCEREDSVMCLWKMMVYIKGPPVPFRALCLLWGTHHEELFAPLERTETHGATHMSLWGKQEPPKHYLKVP